MKLPEAINRFMTPKEIEDRFPNVLHSTGNRQILAHAKLNDSKVYVSYVETPFGTRDVEIESRPGYS